MGPNDSISARAERLRIAIERAFGIRSRTLGAAARKARPYMPRRMRKLIAMITASEAYAAHPKLAATLDQAALSRAEKEVRAWLAQVDRTDLLRAKLIGVAATIAFNLMVVFVLWVGWLIWAGYLGEGL